MKKTKILIPVICFCSLFAITASVGYVLANHSNNVLADRFSGEVKDPFTRTTYYLNEEIEITPKDIIYNDSLLTCTDFYIIYPSGIKKNKTNLKLTELGEYKIVYIADDGNKIVEAIDKIYAFNKAFSCNKEGSSSVYIDEMSLDQKGMPAIATTLVEGDTWTFNQAIDISNSRLDTPVLKYYTRQMSELGNHMSLDVDATVIRLTDFYNSKNYIEITNTYNVCNQSTGRVQPFVLAGAAGQNLVGLDLLNRSSSTVVYNGTTYYFHNSGAWGASLDIVPGRTSPITGKSYNPDISNSDNRGFALYYNDNDKTLYVYHNVMHLVTDLDEPAIYGNNLFKGFTTGEVILSISGKGYKENSAYFEITEINGIKGAELNKEFAYDDKAPVITLSRNANNFKIAKNEEFTIFKASVSDPHLVGDVKAEVFYDYGTSNQRFIPLNDGKFTPKFIGEYSIVYTASDSYGNVAKKVVTCQCITTPNNEILSLKFNPVSTYPAGSYVTLESPIVEGFNEGIYSKITAISETGEDVQEVNPDNPIFLLKRVGEYTIRVEYGDMCCEKIKDFKLESLASDNAYLEQAIFPKYFIKGSNVTLDNNRTILCKSKDIVYGESKVYANLDDSGYGTQPIDINNFEIKADNSIQLKYVYNNIEIYESEKIEVMDVNFRDGINMCEYFDGDFIKNADVTKINFTSSTNVGSCKTTFINPLSFNLLRYDMKLNKTKGFKSFSLIMQDYNKNDEDFVLKFTYAGNTLSVNANGISTDIGETDEIILVYDSINRIMSFGSVSLSIENPFISDKFYLTIQFDGLTDYVGFDLISINNQNFTDTIFDFSSPQISYARLKGERDINSIITITKASVCDVLSPYLNTAHMLSVTYNDGKSNGSTFMSSVDGILLDGSEDPNRDFDLKLDKHGVYTITYSYADQAYSYGYLQPNTITISEVIYVNDNEKPELTINGVTPSTIDSASVGQEVTVRDFIVKDESEVNVVIYAMSPDNRMIKVVNNKFKVDMLGDWTIIYCATDANNNIASAQYKIRVK